MCLDMSLGMCKDMCKDTCIDMCIDKGIDMCTDMCIDKGIDMCTDMCIDVVASKACLNRERAVDASFRKRLLISPSCRALWNLIKIL